MIENCKQNTSRAYKNIHVKMYFKQFIYYKNLLKLFRNCPWSIQLFLVFSQNRIPHKLT